MDIRRSNPGPPPTLPTLPYNPPNTCYLETTVPETLPSTLPATATRCSRTCSQQVVFPAPLRPRATMLWSLRWLSSAQYARCAREPRWAGRPSRRPLGTCRKISYTSVFPPQPVPREHSKTVPQPSLEPRSISLPVILPQPCQRSLEFYWQKPSLGV